MGSSGRSWGRYLTGATCRSQALTWTSRGFRRIGATAGIRGMRKNRLRPHLYPLSADCEPRSAGTWRRGVRRGGPDGGHRFFLKLLVGPAGQHVQLMGEEDQLTVLDLSATAGGPRCPPIGRHGRVPPERPLDQIQDRV